MMLCLCRSVGCCFLIGAEAEGLQSVHGPFQTTLQSYIPYTTIIPVTEHSKCHTTNWNSEIQRETNHKFWAIGLLENTRSTPESTRAKMKGVMFLCHWKNIQLIYNNQYFSGNRDFCCACFLHAVSKHQPCGLSTPDILGTEFLIK
jgi:hypothetical protein